MHALVTGGAGFIGSHLVPRLMAAGHRVTVVDDLSSGRRKNVPAGARLLEARVQDVALDPLVASADVVVHLAAIASVESCLRDPERSRSVNRDATARVAEAMLRAAPDVPLVFSSSAAVYGDCAALPIHEDQPKHPLSPYGSDKWASECVLQPAADRGLPVTVLRFFNVYGPGQRPDSPCSGVVSLYVAAGAAGDPVTVYGDGKQTRDFVHVADVADALVAAARRALPSGTYNVCTGRETSVGELARLAVERLGARSVEHRPARGGEPRRSMGDGARLAAALPGWSPRSVEAGLSGLRSTAAAIRSEPLASGAEPWL